MEKKGLIFAAVISAALLAAGCKDSGKDVTGKPGTPISLKVNGASGKALAEGTVVGVVAGKPAWSDNVSCRVTDGGLLVADSEMSWGSEQTSSSVILAYMPYDKNYTGKDVVTFEVPADQSTQDAITAADLQAGIISGSPKSGNLVLGLEHSLCAMQVTFDNRTLDEIKSVTVSGFMNSCDFNMLTGSVATKGTATTITPFRSTKGGDTYCFIFPPQSTTPRYTVTMKSGKKYTFTYTKPVTPLPGTVIHKEDIVITKGTDEVSILSDAGTSLTKWSTNGIPSFPDYKAQISLAEFQDIKVNAVGSFAVSLNPVSVTHVDNYGYGNSMGVILEDKTNAMYVWLEVGQILTEGQVLFGPVTGKKLVTDSEIIFNSLNIENAKVVDNGTVPSRECTFEQAAAGLDTLKYRRLLFRDVTMTQSFEGDRAIFTQGGISVPVICTDGNPGISAGVKGDLYGFPIVVDNSFAILTSLNNSFAKLEMPEYEGPFGDILEYGIYDLKDAASPKPIFSDCQTSIRKFDDFYSMQVSDYANNVAVAIYLNHQTFIPGRMVNVDFLTNGEPDASFGNFDINCVKVSEELLWLVDTDQNLGFILPLE